MKYYYLGIINRFAAVMAITFFSLSVMQASAQQEYCQTSRGDVGNGYHYEMWIQEGTSGTACLTVYGEDARFKTEWDLSGYGFVSRVGLKFDETRTAEEIGWISSDFEITKSGDGQAWMGIYGWTVDPLLEYYIVEDWNGRRPQMDYEGTITVDGGEYDVYTDMRIEKPSIRGTQTFKQWFSVRQEPRQSGHISISQHFAEWVRLGMEVGNLYEAKLKVEGFNGSGTVEFTTGTVVVGARPDTNVSIIPITIGEQCPFFDNGDAPASLSLISLTGTTVRSARLSGSEPVFVSNDNLATGMYILQIHGKKKASLTKTLILE